MSRRSFAGGFDLKAILQRSKALTYKTTGESEKLVPMQAILDYVRRVAESFRSQLGSSLIEAYRIGSLAHGGFSEIYSDLDVGLILSCPIPPTDIDRMIAAAKALDDNYGRKLSVFGAILSSVGDGCRHWIAWISWITASRCCTSA
jgi:predicted nucleotidyltransferase